MNNENVLFVGGSMRSGTTILHKVLSTAEGSHPYISEAWFIHDLFRSYQFTVPRYDVRARDYFGPRENYDSFILKIIESHIEDVVRRYYPAKRFILKHPELTSAFNLFGRWFPRSKFVINIRDPRDTIASIVEVAGKHTEGGISWSPQAIAGRDMDKLCAQFLSYYTWMAHMNADLAARIVLVKYEDLMTNPQVELERIQSELGFSLNVERIMAFEDHPEASANMNAAERQKDSFSAAFWSDLYTKNLSPSRIGRFRQILTPREIEEIETRCAEFGKRYGYF